MSYGTNSPWGLQPYSYLGGSLWTGQTSEYQIASGYVNTLFTNDPISRLADGTVGIGIIGGAVIGSFQGCKYVDTTGIYRQLPYWTANTVTRGGLNATCLVTDDPNILYDAQVSSAGAASLATPSILPADLNSNINFAVTPVSGVTPSVTAWTGAGAAQPNNPGAGNTRTGLSGYYLNYASIANTATLNLTIVRITPVITNSAGLMFNNALVLINNDPYKAGTGAAGV